MTDEDDRNRSTGCSPRHSSSRWRAAPLAADDAAGYPSRPITVVVGYPPGGATDIIARLVATKLSQSLGQPVIVENKPGAGSNIATEQVVRAKPDGYTLLVETIANATNMTVYKNIKYDSAVTWRRSSSSCRRPACWCVSPSLKATDLKSLIALAKAEPGKLTFASSGVGGSPHLAGELLKLRAGIDMVHVPYKGATPALMDVISGHVSMGFKTSLGALEQIQAGKLRPIAVAYAKRLPELPDVPTMAEAGLDDFEVSSWNGLAAPAGTPEPIIRKLNEEVNRILAMPDVREQLRDARRPGGGRHAAGFRRLRQRRDREVARGDQGGRDLARLMLPRSAQDAPMTRIALVTTGGTIVSRIDERTGLAMPVLSGDELVRTLRGLTDTADLEVIDYIRVASPQIAPHHWVGLHDRIQALVDARRHPGVVVTHGTSTLEETAWFLDLTLRDRQAGGPDRRPAQRLRGRLRRAAQPARRAARVPLRRRARTGRAGGPQ